MVVCYRMEELSLVWNIWVVVELKDANTPVVIVAVERVKQALVVANVRANVLVDASGLHALAAQVKDSAALSVAVVVVVGARY